MSCLERNFKIPPNFEVKDLFAPQFNEPQIATNQQKRKSKSQKRKDFALKITK